MSTQPPIPAGTKIRWTLTDPSTGKTVEVALDRAPSRAEEQELSRQVFGGKHPSAAAQIQAPRTKGAGTVGGIDPRTAGAGQVIEEEARGLGELGEAAPGEGITADLINFLRGNVQPQTFGADFRLEDIVTGPAFAAGSPIESAKIFGGGLKEAHKAQLGKAVANITEGRPHPSPELAAQGHTVVQPMEALFNAILGLTPLVGPILGEARGRMLEPEATRGERLTSAGNVTGILGPLLSAFGVKGRPGAPGRPATPEPGAAAPGRQAAPAAPRGVPPEIGEGILSTGPPRLAPGTRPKAKPRALTATEGAEARAQVQPGPRVEGVSRRGFLKGSTTAAAAAVAPKIPKVRPPTPANKVIQLVHPDGVSGTGIFPGGYKAFWGEGSNEVVVRLPNGKEVIVFVGEDYSALKGKAPKRVIDQVKDSLEEGSRDIDRAMSEADIQDHNLGLRERKLTPEELGKELAEPDNRYKLQLEDDQLELQPTRRGLLAKVGGPAKAVVKEIAKEAAVKALPPQVEPGPKVGGVSRREFLKRAPAAAVGAGGKATGAAKPPKRTIQLPDETSFVETFDDGTVAYWDESESVTLRLPSGKVISSVFADQVGDLPVSALVKRELRKTFDLEAGPEIGEFISLSEKVKAEQPRPVPATPRAAGETGLDDILSGVAERDPSTQGLVKKGDLVPHVHDEALVPGEGPRLFPSKVVDKLPDGTEIRENAVAGGKPLTQAAASLGPESTRVLKESVLSEFAGKYEGKGLPDGVHQFKILDEKAPGLGVPAPGSYDAVLIEGGKVVAGVDVIGGNMGTIVASAPGKAGPLFKRLAKNRVRRDFTLTSEGIKALEKQTPGGPEIKTALESTFDDLKPVDIETGKPLTQAQFDEGLKQINSGDDRVYWAESNAILRAVRKKGAKGVTASEVGEVAGVGQKPRPRAEGVRPIEGRAVETSAAAKVKLPKPDPETGVPGGTGGLSPEQEVGAVFQGVKPGADFEGFPSDIAAAKTMAKEAGLLLEKLETQISNTHPSGKPTPYEFWGVSKTEAGLKRIVDSWNSRDPFDFGAARGYSIESTRRFVERRRRRGEGGLRGFRADAEIEAAGKLKVGQSVTLKKGGLHTTGVQGTIESIDTKSGTVVVKAPDGTKVRMPAHQALTGTRRLETRPTPSAPIKVGTGAKTITSTEPITVYRAGDKSSIERGAFFALDSEGAEAAKASVGSKARIRSREINPRKVVEVDAEALYDESTPSRWASWAHDRMVKFGKDRPDVTGERYIPGEDSVLDMEFLAQSLVDDGADAVKFKNHPDAEALNVDGAADQIFVSKRLLSRRGEEGAISADLLTGGAESLAEPVMVKVHPDLPEVPLLKSEARLKAGKQPGSRLFFEKALESSIPGSGPFQRVREAQNKAMEALSEAVVKRIHAMDENAYVSGSRAIAAIEDAKEEALIAARELYAKVDVAAKGVKVPTHTLKIQARALKKEVTQAKRLLPADDFKKAAVMLDKILKAPTEVTFAEMSDFRSGLLARTRAIKEAIPDKGGGMVKKLVSEADASMERAAQKSGGDLLSLWRGANTQYKATATTFNRTVVAKMLDEVPEKIHLWVAKAPLDEIPIIRSVMPADRWQSIKAHIIRDAIEKAMEGEIDLRTGSKLGEGIKDLTFVQPSPGRPPPVLRFRRLQRVFEDRLGKDRMAAIYSQSEREAIQALLDTAAVVHARPRDLVGAFINGYIFSEGLQVVGKVQAGRVLEASTEAGALLVKVGVINAMARVISRPEGAGRLARYLKAVNRANSRMPEKLRFRLPPKNITPAIAAASRALFETTMREARELEKELER